MQKRLAKFGYAQEGAAHATPTPSFDTSAEKPVQREKNSSTLSEDPIVLPPQGQPRRRRHQDTIEASPESKYAPTGARKRGASDPWSQPAKIQRVSDSESENDLVADDAPYIMESSESEAPPATNLPKRPAKKRMLNMAGRAKRFVKSTARKLSKSDRIHFWNNKAGAAPSNEG